MLRWYAVVLAQWMEGYGLSSIIVDSIRHKEQHNGTVKIHGKFYEYYGTQQDKNAVIAETLSIIDNVVLFSIANYFLKFSTEYKKKKALKPLITIGTNLWNTDPLTNSRFCYKGTDFQVKNTHLFIHLPFSVIFNMPSIRIELTSNKPHAGFVFTWNGFRPHSA